jgi:hypothetical protein
MLKVAATHAKRSWATFADPDQSFDPSPFDRLRATLRVELRVNREIRLGRFAYRSGCTSSFSHFQHCFANVNSLRVSAEFGSFSEDSSLKRRIHGIRSTETSSEVDKVEGA